LFEAALVADPGSVQVAAPERPRVVDPALDREALIQLFPALDPRFVHDFPAGIQAASEFVAGCGTVLVVAVLGEAGLTVSVPKHIAAGLLQALHPGFTSIEAAVPGGLPAFGDAFPVDFVLGQHGQGDCHAQQCAESGKRHVRVQDHLHLLSPFSSVEPRCGASGRLRAHLAGSKCVGKFPTELQYTWNIFPRQYGI
jgi:hypothetical protein